MKKLSDTIFSKCFQVTQNLATESSNVALSDLTKREIAWAENYSESQFCFFFYQGFCINKITFFFIWALLCTYQVCLFCFNHEHEHNPELVLALNGES